MKKYFLTWLRFLIAFIPFIILMASFFLLCIGSYVARVILGYESDVATTMLAANEDLLGSNVSWMVGEEL